MKLNNFIKSVVINYRPVCAIRTLEKEASWRSGPHWGAHAQHMAGPQGLVDEECAHWVVLSRYTSVCLYDRQEGHPWWHMRDRVWLLHLFSSQGQRAQDSTEEWRTLSTLSLIKSKKKKKCYLNVYLLFIYYILGNNVSSLGFYKIWSFWILHLLYQVNVGCQVREKICYN